MVLQRNGLRWRLSVVVEVMVANVMRGGLGLLR